MNIIIKIGGTDASDYVIRCSKIPVVKRNRNWELVTDGFDMDISFSYPGTINELDLVEFIQDGNSHYLGRVKYSRRTEDGCSYKVDVVHYFLDLDTKLVQYEFLHEILNNTSPFTIAQTFIVNITTNVVTKATHGLSLGDRIQLKSTGTLPTPLTANHYYYVSVLDANTFKLYNNYEDYIIPNPEVDFTDTGTGVHSFSKITDTELNKYCDHSTGFSYPRLNLKWFITKLFSLFNLSIDTSLVDSQVLYNLSSTVTFNWSELYFMENNIYCFNQSKAMRYTAIDDNSTSSETKKQKISCLTLVRDLCSYLGWQFKYIGAMTYKIYPQKRILSGDSIGDIDSLNEPLYAIADNDKLEYEEYIVEGDASGYMYSWKTPDPALSGGSTLAYNNGAAADLIERIIVSTDDANNSIDLLNNFRLFLKDKTGAAGDILMSFDSTLANEFAVWAYVTNLVLALQMNFDYERIVAPLNMTNFTVKEVNADIENLTMEIIQERNTGESAE